MFYSRNRLNFNLTEKKGFTLIEVLVVVAIIGILTGIAIPNITDWAVRYRLKSAARDLVSNMIKAKTQAIAMSTPHTFNFQNNIPPNVDNYTVDIAPCITYPAGTTLGPFELSPGHSNIEYDTINLVNNQIVFRPNGTVLGGGGDITLKNNKGEDFTITVFITGAIKVSK